MNDFRLRTDVRPSAMAFLTPSSMSAASLALSPFIERTTLPVVSPFAAAYEPLRTSAILTPPSEDVQTSKERPSGSMTVVSPGMTATGSALSWIGT